MIELLIFGTEAITITENYIVLNWNYIAEKCSPFVFSYHLFEFNSSTVGASILTVLNATKYLLVCSRIQSCLVLHINNSLKSCYINILKSLCSVG